MLAIVLFVVIVIFYIGRYHWLRRDLYLAANKFDGPLALPILGNGLMFLCKNEDVLERLYTTFLRYKNPIRLWMGPKLLVAFQDADLVEKILSSSKFAQKHELYDQFKPFLGEGLVSASGPRYRNHRRFIQPLFDNSFCEGVIGTFQNHIDICMEKLDAFVGKRVFDINETLHKCYDDIIADSVLGTKLRAQEGQNKNVVRTFAEGYEVCLSRLVRPWLYPDIIYDRTSYSTLFKFFINVKDEFVKKVVTESRQRRKMTDKSESFPQPIVDQLTEHVENNSEFMTAQELQDHLTTLFTASEDTMSLVSSFICVCLGMYPEYQAKVAEEIRLVFGDTPRQVEIGDISKLTYLDMCIKDCLRLSPVAPYILRQNTQDTYIGDWFMPKGCSVIVPIFNLHRDPRYWENPHHFHPDHFLPEAVKDRHIYAYVPFSAGPRGCIGKIFANLGLKVMLASLLQRYEIHAEGKFPDFKLKMDISIRPVHGYNVTLTKRVWK